MKFGDGSTLPPTLLQIPDSSRAAGRGHIPHAASPQGPRQDPEVARLARKVRQAVAPATRAEADTGSAYGLPYRLD